ncbi:hypothetical protein KGF54_000977 [Candida jiufengensis]|uniref:uncharacterized protein n=1 Tax=Candida jiufengensis TaxID=497108 RepID=UPI00222569A1|nr:uncharacterized protein KGF54_000977 [Candida jiufengensis]KAI5956502.1 hypothetical protein KGF54_000977 [Candida jiufengensis]
MSFLNTAINNLPETLLETTNYLQNLLDNDNQLLEYLNNQGNNSQNLDTIDNQKQSYYIPTIEDFSVHDTNRSRNNSIDYSSYYDTSTTTNSFCTPRSSFTINSIESEIENLPSCLKPNIWKNEIIISNPFIDQQFIKQYQQQLPTPKSLNTQNDIQLQIQQKLNLSIQLKEEQKLKQQQQEQIEYFNSNYINNEQQSLINLQNQQSNNFRSSQYQQFDQYPISPSDLPNFYNSLVQSPPPPPHQQQQPQQQPYLTFRNYCGNIFTVPFNSRFFIIKSYNILDVNASFTHNIWTSTELGNKRLDRAFKELQTSNSQIKGKVFLLFSVNSSGKFCGISEMKSCLDYSKQSDIWCEQSKYKGIFPVEWLLIKDVPNRFFQHLKIPANDFKPVTNSRDTQEIPFDIGISMLKIISSFKNND